MLALPLSILALSAGIYLLIKVKRDFLGTLFEVLAWLVILLSIASIGFLGFKALRPCCGKGGDCKKEAKECRAEKQACGNVKQGCCEKEVSSCKSAAVGCGDKCTVQGDSVVMQPSECAAIMGKEKCDAMIKDRGQCIMSKEECRETCRAAGKPCCLEGEEPKCHKESKP